MKIIKLSQSDDREAWLEERRSRIMGTKAKSVLPLERKKDGSTTPSGFWELLAENIAVSSDTNAMRRGHEIENEAILSAIKMLDIDPETVDLDPGMWLSDENDHIGSSSDGAEKSDNPTFVFEAKCFDSAKHIKTILYDLICQNIDNPEFLKNIPPELIACLPDIPSVYNPLNSVPKDNRAQVIQYFITNENQEIVYFVLYDDRIAIESLATHVITIHRADIEGQILAQKDAELRQLAKVKQILKFLKGL